MSFYRWASSALLAAVGVMASAQSVEYVPREILVKFKGTEAVGAISASQANRGINAQSLNVIPKILVTRIRIPQGMSHADAVAYYKRLPTVEFAEPNVKVKAHYIPNDPKWNNQYGQKLVKCPEAWNITKGKSTVVVAVIDSGADFNHEDLKNKYTNDGYDFSDNDPDPTASGDHGVHCAGIVGAETDNGKGVAGTGFNVKVMPIKIFPNSTFENSAKAIIYAADHGAKVISMSYGGYFESQAEKNAVNYAWGKGVVLLASSGNDGIQEISYPGGHTNVIGVGSVGETNNRSGFSNYGNWVDVCAPGEDIDSTIIGGNYAEFTGTSMSCPMAAGVVALMWSQAIPGTTNVQIRQILESTTDPNGGGGFKFGRVNAFKACAALDPGSATISNATGVDIWTGAGYNGSASDLNNTDASFVTVTTATSNLGQLGGVTVNIGFNGPTTNLREAIAYIEANGVAGSTGQLYILNNQTGKYDLIKAIALQPTGTKREKIVLPLNLSKYVSGGVMKLGIRAIGPNRNPRTWGGGVFDFKIGFVQIATRENFS